MELSECAAQLCYILVGGRQLFYAFIHIHTIYVYAYAATYLSLFSPRFFCFLLLEVRRCAARVMEIRRGVDSCCKRF